MARAKARMLMGASGSMGLPDDFRVPLRATGKADARSWFVP
jgi:hypothetical protein